MKAFVLERVVSCDHMHYNYVLLGFIFLNATILVMTIINSCVVYACGQYILMIDAHVRHFSPTTTNFLSLKLTIT